MNANAPLNTSHYLRVQPEVADAISDGRPVVALESTIISHGMPYPENVETARGLEEIVRSRGAVPATIAVAEGAFRIGLDEQTLELFGTSNDIMKASRRDLGYAFSQARLAATTVATTMIGAHMAGIRVFATGGTGGVHRGGHESFDISADLQELSRTPVAVVSAGVKSILDIGRTLEYLETHGVPVIGFGVDEFPAFYSRTSGAYVSHRLDTAGDVAALLQAQWESGLGGGALVANPIPREAEMEYAAIEKAIQTALSDAEQAGVQGREVTPFLLGRIVEITGGESLRANIALVRNNATVAADIARELAA